MMASANSSGVLGRFAWSATYTSALVQLDQRFDGHAVACEHGPAAERDGSGPAVGARRGAHLLGRRRSTATSIVTTGGAHDSRHLRSDPSPRGPVFVTVGHRCRRQPLLDRALVVDPFTRGRWFVEPARAPSPFVHRPPTSGRAPGRDPSRSRVRPPPLEVGPPGRVLARDRSPFDGSEICGRMSPAGFTEVCRTSNRAVRPPRPRTGRDKTGMNGASNCTAPSR